MLKRKPMEMSLTVGGRDFQAGINETRLEN